MSYVPRLKKQYDEEVVPKLQERFEYKSSMQVPKIEKICLNQGLGKAIADRKTSTVPSRNSPRSPARRR